MVEPARITKDQLRERRVELGLSQDELADELGVARGTVSRWENGGLKVPPYLGDTLTGLEARLKRRKKK